MEAPVRDCGAAVPEKGMVSSKSGRKVFTFPSSQPKELHLTCWLNVHTLRIAESTRFIGAVYWRVVLPKLPLEFAGSTFDLICVASPRGHVFLCTESHPPSSTPISTVYWSGSTKHQTRKGAKPSTPRPQSYLTRIPIAVSCQTIDIVPNPIRCFWVAAHVGSWVAGVCWSDIGDQLLVSLIVFVGVVILSFPMRAVLQTEYCSKVRKLVRRHLGTAELNPTDKRTLVLFDVLQFVCSIMTVTTWVHKTYIQSVPDWIIS
eukprot:3465170-Pyramimonas_sp.AAC.1